MKFIERQLKKQVLKLEIFRYQIFEILLSFKKGMVENVRIDIAEKSDIAEKNNRHSRKKYNSKENSLNSKSKQKIT